MKKSLGLICLALAFVLVFACCSKGSKDIVNNLEKAGYTITPHSEERLETLNESLRYNLGGKGEIVSGYSAKNDDGLNAIVLVFENKDDLELIYRQIKKELNSSESIDFSGKVLVYGSKVAVRKALG